MIKTIKHKALKRAVEKGDSYQKVCPQKAKRLKALVSALSSATCLQDISDIPGGNLHPYKEKKPMKWSLNVSGNMRLIFEFDEETGEVNNLDYYDPH